MQAPQPPCVQDLAQKTAPNSADLPSVYASTSLPAPEKNNLIGMPMTQSDDDDCASDTLDGPSSAVADDWDFEGLSCDAFH